MDLVLKKTVNQDFSGGHFLSVPKSVPYKHEKIFNHLREEGDVKLINCNERKEFVNIILTQELNKKPNEKVNFFAKGDTELMNRIIRNGGLIEYTKLLESKCTTSI